MADERPRLLLIGAVPPPHHGVSTINALLLQAPQLARCFDIRHLDLSDHRPIGTVEKFDWQNVSGALTHGLRGLWRMLTWRPDVVYLPISQKPLGFLRDVLFLVPARLLRRRTVVHLHGGNFHTFFQHAGWWLRQLIRFSLRNVQRAIVLGANLRGCFTGLVPTDRVVVVPNGIPDFARNETRKPGESLRVLFLGTLAREKGIDIFLRVALEVLVRTDTVEFTVAGPWYREGERQQLEALVRAHPHASKIRFVGEVTGRKKTEVLLTNDVLIFPSVQQEGLPLTVLEGMCAGLAVIASDRGCLREVVKNGETGFLVPPGDVGAITTKIEQLAANPSLCAQMGRAGRQQYEAWYTADQFLERLTNSLIRICGERRHRTDT